MNNEFTMNLHDEDGLLKLESGTKRWILEKDKELAKVEKELKCSISCSSCDLHVEREPQLARVVQAPRHEEEPEDVRNLRGADSKDTNEK